MRRLWRNFKFFKFLSEFSESLFHWNSNALSSFTGHFNDKTCIFAVAFLPPLSDAVVLVALLTRVFFYNRVSLTNSAARKVFHLVLPVPYDVGCLACPVLYIPPPVSWTISAACFGLVFALNGLMWTVFVSALQASSSTVEVTVLNTTANFLSSVSGWYLYSCFSLTCASLHPPLQLILYRILISAKSGIGIPQGRPFSPDEPNKHPKVDLVIYTSTRRKVRKRQRYLILILIKYWVVTDGSKAGLLLELSEYSVPVDFLGLCKQVEARGWGQSWVHELARPLG